MCARSVLSNILQFAKILHQSSSDDVKHWDLTSTQNALNWAEYSHEIFKHVSGQPCEKDLESQLHKMTILLQPISCLLLSVDSLGQAKEILVETLLSNPSLSCELRSHLISVLQADRESASFLSKVQDKLTKSQEMLMLSEDMAHILQQEQSEAKGQMAKFRGQSRLLGQQLLHIGLNGNRADRFQAYCLQVFDRISQTCNVDVLVGLLCLTEPLDEQATAVMTKIVQHTIVWMASMVEFSSIHVLQSSPMLLTKAACRHHQFLELYLRMLCDWAEQYLPCVTVSYNATTSWQSPAGCNLKDLTIHFESLLMEQELTFEARGYVLDLITRKINDTEFSVWTPLAKSLFFTLKNA